MQALFDKLLKRFPYESLLPALRVEALVQKYALDPLDISIIAVQILFVTVTKGRCTQSEIQEYVQTSASNISQRISWLEKEGLIKRRRSRKDRRKIFISPTPKGKMKLVKAIKASTQVKSTLLKGFTEREIEIFADLHKRFLENVESAEAELKKSHTSRKAPA